MPFRPVGLSVCLLFLATLVFPYGRVNVSGQGRLLVYPYLGETTPTSVVISWVTSENGPGKVRYSIDKSYNNVVPAVTTTHDGKHWHSATIIGLTANTTYWYKTYTNDSDVTPWPEAAFTTAPQSTEPVFTFVAWGDSRPSSNTTPPRQGARDVAAEMDRHSFDLALHTGDIVYAGGNCSGSGSSWNQYIRGYFDLYRETTGDTPFYPSLGNHEIEGGSCGYQAYTDIFFLPGNAPPGHREKYYSFDWGTAHIVALDTNQSFEENSTQYEWLVSDLQSNSRPWTFVFFHHSPYSSGHHGGSIEVRTDLVPVFETYDVDVVFSGHDHGYERTCPIREETCTTPQDGGIVYYVTGGGGAPLYDVGNSWFTAHSDRLYHFVRIVVDGCHLHMDAIATNGDVFDSYEIDHCAAPIWLPMLLR
jgi:hypothetical protein